MEFHARTFDEIAAMVQKHGVEMFQKEDQTHIEAMNKMRELMKSPQALNDWFESKRNEFEALPDNA